MFLTEIRHNGSQISLGVNTIKVLRGREVKKTLV